MNVVERLCSWLSFSAMVRPRKPRLSAPSYEVLIEWLEKVQSHVQHLETIVSALSDKTDALTQAVSDNTTATNNAVTKIGSGSDADTQAAIAAIDAATTQIKANTDALTNATPAQ